ncbi:hypothetical protein Tco_0399092, partial [Tanacetum coccineum]
MTLVRPMASLTGGLEERNSTSTNTVSPLIVKQSDRRCEFSVYSVLRSVPSQYSRKTQPSAQDRQDQS